MPSTLQDENPDPLHNIAGFLSDFSKALVTSDSEIYLPIQALFKLGQRQTPGNSRRTAGRLPFFPRNVGALNTGTQSGSLGFEAAPWTLWFETKTPKSRNERR